ncbi:hypothetical protein [Mesorhizobium sp.]|uniref:hypothetical protein n=1 Tax=Mesorhizobium sp. TaxID=1871066 RepID=UPI0025E44A12|nr:hypothetical protein [Mesorhizobium sp.]
MCPTSINVPLTLTDRDQCIGFGIRLLRRSKLGRIRIRQTAAPRLVSGALRTLRHFDFARDIPTVAARTEAALQSRKGVADVGTDSAFFAVPDAAVRKRLLAQL